MVYRSVEVVYIIKNQIIYLATLEQSNPIGNIGPNVCLLKRGGKLVMALYVYCVDVQR